MAIQTVLNLVVYLACVALGYLISKRLKTPGNSQTWILWVIGVILAGGICVSGHAINIGSLLDLHVNELLQALGIGVLIGFVIAATGKKNSEKASQAGTK